MKGEEGVMATWRGRNVTAADFRYARERKLSRPRSSTPQAVETGANERKIDSRY